jgi:KUP system potassium uptake protein
LAKDRLTVTKLAEGLWRVQARYGFMQAPNVPVIMVSLEKLGLPCNTDKIRYYMGHERVVGTESKKSLQGVERLLFTFLSNNAARPSDYFKIPDDKIVEMGLRVDV